MKAVFLVECGRVFGLGHLRRCQTLARAMMASGWVCVIAVSDQDMVQAIAADGFDVVVWAGDGLNLGHADVLVVDGYHYDPQILDRWKKRAGVCLVFDDLAERPVSADVILNHNLYGMELDYGDYNAQAVICGADYSLVDQKFFAVAPALRSEPVHVVVSFGGVDNGSLAIPVAEKILRGSEDVVVEVVVSSLQASSAGLMALQEQYGSRVAVQQGVEMSEILGRCAVLAGAAGLTVLEALAAGLDVVVCATTENQRLNVQALRKMGYAAFDEFDPDMVSDAVLAILSGEKRAPQTVLDGHGPERVVAVLRDFLRDASGTGA